MNINLHLKNKEKMNLFGKNVFLLIVSLFVVSFLSYFFINLRSAPKQYQRFTVFSSTTLLDENKLTSKIEEFNFDDIYKVSVNKCDENSESFTSNFATNGLHNSDIFILNKNLVNTYAEKFIRISSKFDVNNFEVYSEVAIKCYDSDTKEGLLSNYFINLPEEDLYLLINSNSYHYKSGKKNSTNYAVSFIEGLVK